MKPRNLSTRERAIYDRLTLHARAALAPFLARAAQEIANAERRNTGAGGKQMPKPPRGGALAALLDQLLTTPDHGRDRFTVAVVVSLGGEA